MVSGKTAASFDSIILGYIYTYCIGAFRTQKQHLTHNKFRQGHKNEISPMFGCSLFRYTRAYIMLHVRYANRILNWIVEGTDDEEFLPRMEFLIRGRATQHLPIVSIYSYKCLSSSIFYNAQCFYARMLYAFAK